MRYSFSHRQPYEVSREPRERRELSHDHATLHPFGETVNNRTRRAMHFVYGDEPSVDRLHGLVIADKRIVPLCAAGLQRHEHRLEALVR